MRETWSKFKRFWLEEEVPRWIGLSLVAAYLCGLGALTFVAHRQEQDLTRRTAQAHGDHAMELLAKLLGRLDADDVPALNRTLRDFALRLRCERLRVVDERGMVVASTVNEEIGRARPPEVAQGDAETPKRRNAGTFGTEQPLNRRHYDVAIANPGEGGVRTLEATLRLSTGAGDERSHAWMMVIVLAGMGVLWIVYHLMRRHFRGLTRIAENLTTHAECLEAELASLRVADSLGTVASAWNKLIDLVESLRTEAQRSTAATELRQVLERSGGGELADAIDAVPDGLFVIADEEFVVHCNTAAARLMGWRWESTNRPQLSELSCGATGHAVRQVVESARTAQGGYESHSVVVESEGSSYRVRVVPSRLGCGPSRSTSGRHGSCVVVISDVSQQVRADRAREEFVSQVTHELRTPLTNIRAYSETLSSGMFQDPSVISECYNVINKETRRLSRLIEDILSASQMELGQIQVVCDEVDVRALVREAVRDLRATADEKNIDVQAILPAKVDPIQADRDKLAVVLNNLIGNALKYTPNGGEVRVGCQVTEEHLLITVKDNGVGIAKEEHELVFEKFHRSKDPSVQSQTGTGIGLTTAREIARRHGGDIELYSEKSKGSTFVVKLPRKPAGAACDRERRPSRSETAPTAQRSEVPPRAGQKSEV